MPEDDRLAPDSSSASANSQKAFTYDTYMCPEPHQEFPLEDDDRAVNHSKLILDSLMAARSQFQERGQLRLSAELSLECAKEFAGGGAWEDVVLLLQPLWQDMSFRAEGWQDVTEDLCWTLRAAAAEMKMPDLILAIDWELICRCVSRCLYSREYLTDSERRLYKTAKLAI
jgi:hypothetical protein